MNISNSKADKEVFAALIINVFMICFYFLIVFILFWAINHRESVSNSIKRLPFSSRPYQEIPSNNVFVI